MTARLEALPLSGGILLVGAGKMGGAMLRGWLEHGLPAEKVVVHDPSPPEEIAELIGHWGVATGLEACKGRDFQAVVLAVKPQAMADVIPPIQYFRGVDTVVISVAAGWTIANFTERFGSDAAIVRVMPNTLAAIGRGMMVACPNGNVTDKHRALCDALIAANGETAWIDDESLMDAVTAVSGSGPAYVFLLADTLAEAGKAAGLPASLANRLARQTVAGAGELLYRETVDPATLRKNVTSPGGTTAAALSVLMAEDGLALLMKRAVAAAKKRGEELQD